MTYEKLERLGLLHGSIIALEDAIRDLENTDFEYIEIRGMCSDGVSDQIITTHYTGTDGLVECIKTFLTNELNVLKKEFEEA